MSPGYEDDSVTGIETTEPAFGLPALWIDEAMKERADLAGYTVVDPPSVVATHLTELIKRHAHELIGRQETKALVDNIRESYPVLVDELIPSVLTIGEVQKVLAKRSAKNLDSGHGHDSRDPCGLWTLLERSRCPYRICKTSSLAADYPAICSRGRGYAGHHGWTAT